MQTSSKTATRHTVDAASALHDPDTDAGTSEHPDDWHEDRLSLAIRVIEALGLRPVGSAASVLH